MGTAHLIKKDIFKNLMWYILPNNTKHYPLTIDRVKEIKRLNKQGQRVDELQAVEIVNSKQKEAEPAFVELVGQISLKSLEKNDRRRRDQQRSNQSGPQRNPNQGPHQGPNQGPNKGPRRPQQNNPQQSRGPRGPQQNRPPRPGQGNNPPNGPKPE
jgi:hypothetical protein